MRSVVAVPHHGTRVSRFAVSLAPSACSSSPFRSFAPAIRNRIHNASYNQHHAMLRSFYRYPPHVWSQSLPERYTILRLPLTMVGRNVVITTTPLEEKVSVLEEKAHQPHSSQYGLKMLGAAMSSAYHWAVRLLHISSQNAKI